MIQPLTFLSPTLNTEIKITYLYSSSFDRIVQCRDSLLNGYELHQLLKIKTINDDIIIKETTYMEESQINEPFKNVIFYLDFFSQLNEDLQIYCILSNLGFQFKTLLIL